MTTPRLLQRFEAQGDASTLASLLPQRTHTPEGAPRRVGVEVEFAGLEARSAAEIVREVLGGVIHEDTPYELRIVTEPLGEFVVEIDNRFLKDLGRERESGVDPGVLATSAETLMALAAGNVTPVELVTPPMPIDALPRIQEVLDALGRAGGEGTEGSLFSAFGVHFNPEAASHEAADLHAHLRAFVALFEWLREVLDTDTTRRLTPYVDPYPRDYVVRLLGAEEPPATRAQLVGEYLAANPTRNRALDMLPLFAHLEPGLVHAGVDDPRLNARPTFHYRLPDSRVGAPDWSLLDAWRTWVVIEDVAQDPPLLNGLCAQHLEALSGPFDPARDEVVSRTREWLTGDRG